MAELLVCCLRCCSLLGNCPGCCQIFKTCGRCYSDKKGGGACLGAVCILVIFGLSVMCLGFSITYSDTANGDLATTSCYLLCGSEYVDLDKFTCCHQGDKANCQGKEACRQDLQTLSDQWLAGCLALASIVFSVVFVLGVCICYQKCKESRHRKKQSLSSEQKLKSLLKEPTLDKFKVSSTSAMSCRICLRGFEKGQTLVRMECSHDFHHDCMQDYLKVNFNCPICQKLINARH